MKRLSLWAALAAAVLATSCAMWTRIDSPTIAGPSEAYFVDAPVGWVQLTMYTDGIRMTRDGFSVQLMDVTLTPHGKELARTKKATSANMPAQELAEALLADLRGQPGLGNLTVKETVPARIGPYNGFRVQAQFRNERGVAFSMVIYGAALPQGRLVLLYQAIDRHFFARDLPAFEGLVKSWRTKRAA